jgi:hypothetical protein
MTPNPIRRRLAALALAGAALAAPALAAMPAGAADAPLSGKVPVEVGDNYFKPIDVTVTAGSKVTWTNKGKILHSVKADKGKPFAPKTLAVKKKYTVTFKKPGTYGYYCTFHGAPGSGQHGTITVVAATPTTTTTSTP